MGDRQPKVFIRAWDVVAGMHAGVSTHVALTASARLVAVLFPEYLAHSKYGSAEWLAVWSDDPGGFQRRVVPVRVKECQSDELLQPIHYIDLVGHDGASATDTLLSGIKASLEGRAKPVTAPEFPGLGRPTAVTVAGPPFPGPPVLVGEPPAVPPNWFQDRNVEVEDVERRLGDSQVGLVMVAGPEGVGNTAMIHQLRERIRAGKSPLHVVRSPKLAVDLEAHTHAR